MDIDEIRALIEAMASSDLAEMQVEKDGWTLRLARGSSAVLPVPSPAPNLASNSATTRAPSPPRAPAASPRSDTVADTAIRAPLSGIVYFNPAPDAPAFVSVGDAVAVGDVVCVIEAMKAFNEIRTERAGTVEAILAAPGEEVDAGRPLLRIV